MIDREVDDFFFIVTIEAERAGNCPKSVVLYFDGIPKYFAAAIWLRVGRTLNICLLDNIVIINYVEEFLD